MKKIHSLLRKCKSLSRQLSRSSSYTTLRYKSTSESFWVAAGKTEEDDLPPKIAGKTEEDDHYAVIYVGSTRKRYVISSKYLTHPVFNALIEKSRLPAAASAGDGGVISVRCEVVLFDHLLWMLEKSDPSISSESNLEELAELYVF